MSQVAKGQRNEREVIAVALDVAATAADPERVMALLAEEIGVRSRETLIVLPPLVANIMALPELPRSASLLKAVKRAGRSRWGRRFAVWFTYPHVRGHRRPWLVMHDVVHSALRKNVGGLAKATGCTLVGGTVLLSHPRTHWEAWPDHGELFHTAWSFGSDSEPFDVVRQPRCRLSALADAKVDGNDELELRALHTGDVDVAPLWGDAVPQTPIAWFPQVRYEGEEGLDVSALVARAPHAEVWVVSALSGRLGAPLAGEASVTRRGAGGATTTESAEAPTRERPATWVSASFTLPEGYATEEPTGAP